MVSRLPGTLRVSNSPDTITSSKSWESKKKASLKVMLQPYNSIANLKQWDPKLSSNIGGANRRFANLQNASRIEFFYWAVNLLLLACSKSISMLDLLGYWAVGEDYRFFKSSLLFKSSFLEENKWRTAMKRLQDWMKWKLLFLSAIGC